MLLNPLLACTHIAPGTFGHGHMSYISRHVVIWHTLDFMSPWFNILLVRRVDSFRYSTTGNNPANKCLQVLVDFIHLAMYVCIFPNSRHTIPASEQSRGMVTLIMCTMCTCNCALTWESVEGHVFQLYQGPETVLRSSTVWSSCTSQTNWTLWIKHACIWYGLPSVSTHYIV